MLIGDIIDVWKRGKSVANPVMWKNIGVTAGAVAGLISSSLAVAGAFGYRVDVSDDVVQALAMGVAGVLSVVCSGLHITTTDKIGLPGAPIDSGERGRSAVGAIDESPDYRG